MSIACIGEPACLVCNQIDVSDAMREISQHADEWDRFTMRQDYPGSAHRDTRSIFVRWAPEWTYESIFTSHDAVDYPAARFMPHICRLVDACAQAVEATSVGRVLVASLKPDGRVSSHWDQGEYAHHFDRFHLCLQGEENSYLRVDDVQVRSLPGELWWFNHQLTHDAFNGSRDDRVHLIMDFTSPYRRRRGL